MANAPQTVRAYIQSVRKGDNNAKGNALEAAQVQIDLLKGATDDLSNRLDAIPVSDTATWRVQIGYAS